MAQKMFAVVVTRVDLRQEGTIETVCLGADSWPFARVPKLAEITRIVRSGLRVTDLGLSERGQRLL